MATVVTTRAPQALRHRRDSHRPTLSKATNKAPVVETASNQRTATQSKLLEPHVKTTEYILRKFRGRPPSLILHLHPTHFRFDQQDGSFTYNSPMRFILEHIKAQTVPHDMLEELFQSNVPFYDGCLIVQVYDHKSGAGTAPTSSSIIGAGDKSVPFSIHNYNNFITPSPYVPFPTKDKTTALDDAEQCNIGDAREASGNDAEKAERENMPAPGQPASASAKNLKKPKIITTVLFSTPLSLQAEISILSRTPAPDSRSTRRQSRDGGTPTMAHPPTPLAAVPSTPSSIKGPPHKHQKMVLDESNVHEFEADVLRSTELPLYLEPVTSFAESLTVIDALRDPLHENKAPAPKSRKRTVAELAADEALAAEEERFMLIMDERLAPSSGANPSGTGAVAGEGQGTSGAFEPRFSRFKTLENIRMRHEEEERAKKEEEARNQLAKKQQSEAEALRRRELEERQLQEQRMAMARQQQQEKALQQQQQEQQRQQQQKNLQQQATTAAQSPVQISNGMPNPQVAQIQQASQQHMSPVLRQHTPHNSSSPMIGNAVTSHPTGSMPMTASSSTQGAGSPPRPTSAMQQRPPSAAAQVAMARQISQQHSQPGNSRTGTPQMIHSTPNLGLAVPVTRHMTPQPRGTHGSPVNGMAVTSAMMGTPQIPQGQPLSEQQINYLRARQTYRQQAGAQGSPMQHMSPEQAHHFAMLRAQQQAQAAAHQQNPMGVSQPAQPPGMTAQNYNQLLMRQMHAQMQQAQMANAQGSQAGSPNGMPNGAGHQGLNINMNPAGGLPQGVQNVDIQTLQRAHTMQRLRQATVFATRQLMNQVAAQNGGQVPPHMMPQIQAQAQAQAQNQLQAQMQAQAQGLAPHMQAGNQVQSLDPAAQQRYFQGMQRAKQQMMAAQMGRGQPGGMGGMGGPMGMQGGQGRGMG